MLEAMQLKQIMPACSSVDPWVGPLNAAMQEFDIGSRERIAAFLAQIAHESGELGRLTENLSYSAARLTQVWPKRFPSREAALPYERNPQRLADYVYANRLGNGNAASGDGWRYRGRGLLQLTGRGNYRSVGSALTLPLEASPELLEQPLPAARSAAYFWKTHGLNELADDHNSDNDDEDFVTICVRINGGYAGLRHRQQYWARAKAVLT